MNTLGAYLKEMRKKSGLSLKEVHAHCGITDSKLSRMERDEGSQLTPIELRKLAKLYQIDLVQLFLVAGYLDESDLATYQLVFRDASLLTLEEKQHIQEQIDLFIKGRTVSANGV